MIVHLPDKRKLVGLIGKTDTCANTLTLIKYIHEECYLITEVNAVKHMYM